MFEAWEGKNQPFYTLSADIVSIKIQSFKCGRYIGAFTSPSRYCYSRDGVFSVQLEIVVFSLPVAQCNIY